MSEYLEILQVMHTLNCEAYLPSVSHMMSLLLTTDDESPILNATVWRLVNQRTCLKDRTGELQRFKESQSKLKEWLQSILAKDQVELAKALKKSSSSPIVVRAEALMESFQDCVERLTPMTKPSIAEMENIVEQRSLMNQLDGQNIQDILGLVSKHEVQDVERAAFQEFINSRARVDEHSRKFAEAVSLASSGSQSTLRSLDHSIRSRQGSVGSEADVDAGSNANGDQEPISPLQRGHDEPNALARELKKQGGESSAQTSTQREGDEDSDKFAEFLGGLHADDAEDGIRTDDMGPTFKSAASHSFMDAPGSENKPRKSVFAPRRKTASTSGVFSAMAQVRAGAPVATSSPAAGSAAMHNLVTTDAINSIKVSRKAQEKLRKNKAWYFQNSHKVKTYFRQRAVSFFGMENVVDRYLLNLMAAVAWLGLSELLQQQASHSACRTAMIELSGHFVRVILPLFERVLSFQPELLHEDIFHSTSENAPPAPHNKLLRRILQKITIFETILLSIDIHLFPFTLMCHEGGVKSICLSRTDPNIILTAGYDRLIRIWDLRDNGKMLAQFAGHHSIVPWASFSSNDVLVVSCSFDATVRVWRAYSAKCIRTLNGHTDSVLNGDISPDDKLVLSCSMDSTVRLWIVSTGLCHKVFKGHQPGSWVKCVKFTADGKKFISAGLDKKLIVWDIVESYAPVAVLDEAHSDYILDMVVRKDHLATVSKDRCLKWWTVSDCINRTETARKSSTVSPTAWSSAVAFSLDSRLTACAAFDNCICIYSTIGAKLLRQLHVQNQGVLRIIFSRSSDSIICGTSDGSVQVLPLCSHLYVDENAAAEDGVMMIVDNAAPK
jgi:WD40 repeat protein